MFAKSHLKSADFHVSFCAEVFTPSMGKNPTQVFCYSVKTEVFGYIFALTLNPSQPCQVSEKEYNPFLRGEESNLPVAWPVLFTRPMSQQSRERANHWCNTFLINAY